MTRAAYPSKESCLALAGRLLAEGLIRTLSRPPREAAELAHRRGGPSVDELEARIRELHARAQERIAQTEGTHMNAKKGIW